MSSAGAGPAVTATGRTAMAEPRRAQACRQPRGTVSDGDVIPACSVPHDLLAAWEQQLDRARRRAGALDLPRGAQLLRLPAVRKREAAPAPAQPVFLQSYRVIEKLADNAHIVPPPVTLRHELGHRVVRQPALRPILPDLIEQRRIRHGVKDRIHVTGVAVAAPGKTRHDKDVVGSPLEALSGYFRNTLAFHRDIERARGLSFEPGRLAWAEQLCSIIQCRKQRCSGRRIDEPHTESIVRIPLFLAQSVECFANIGAAVAEHRRRVPSETASVRHKARHQAASAVELLRIRRRSDHPLCASVAVGFPRICLVEPDAIEELHQREIQYVDPYDRLGAVIAVIVPGAVRREDQVAARGLAALPVDCRVAALVRQNGAAGIRGMDVDRGNVARIVNRHRTAHRAGDLQAPAKPGVGQQKLLAFGEFDRRNIRAARDLGNAIEIRRYLVPPPVMGNGLELGGADPAGGNPPARGEAGIAKPWGLRRGVRLGSQPDVKLCCLGIEPLHRLSRPDRRRRVGHFSSFARANNRRSATSPSSRSMPYSLRSLSAFSSTVRTAGSAVSKTRRFRPLTCNSASFAFIGTTGSRSAISISSIKPSTVMPAASISLRSASAAAAFACLSTSSARARSSVCRRYSA